MTKEERIIVVFMGFVLAITALAVMVIHGNGKPEYHNYQDITR